MIFRQWDDKCVTLDNTTTTTLLSTFITLTVCVCVCVCVRVCVCVCACVPSCLQNYIPPESLTLSCPVCRQTSILPERGVSALQNNFFITNLMEVSPAPLGSPPSRTHNGHGNNRKRSIIYNVNDCRPIYIYIYYTTCKISSANMGF